VRGTGRRGKSRRDLLAWTGIVGPSVFVADWATLGARRPGYSPINDAISRLAERGTSSRRQMTSGFIVYGAGLIGYGLALRGQLPGSAWMMAIGSGVATLGVAAFPLGTPLSGAVHAVFASLGYATLAALPIVSSPALVATGRRKLGGLSLLTGATTGTLLLASAVGLPAHGLVQRLGLTLGDTWVVLSAVAMLR
jgi:hypothetical membrane protein